MDLLVVHMIVLQFLVIGFCQASEVTHTLQYNYTVVTPRVNFTDFTFEGLVDGERFVYYDGNKMKVIPKMKWIQKINADYPYYWNREAQGIQTNLEDLRHLLRSVMKEFNHTEGVHSLQMMYSCELDDDGTTRGYDQYKYDGEDFISLDLNTETWTVDNDKAVTIKHKWEETGVRAKHWKNSLGYKCIDWLKKFVTYGSEALERKNEVHEDTGAIHQEDYLDYEEVLFSGQGPKGKEPLIFICHGSEQDPDVLQWIPGFLIILIVSVLGFVLWRKLKDLSVYVPARNSHMTSSKI